LHEFQAIKLRNAPHEKGRPNRQSQKLSFYASSEEFATRGKKLKLGKGGP